MRFADDRQRERAGPPQVCAHAWRRATRWRLAEAEETTEEPHGPSPACKYPLVAYLEFRGADDNDRTAIGNYSLLLWGRQGRPRKAKIALFCTPNGCEGPDALDMKPGRVFLYVVAAVGFW